MCPVSVREARNSREVGYLDRTVSIRRVMRA